MGSSSFLPCRLSNSLVFNRHFTHFQSNSALQVSKSFGAGHTDQLDVGLPCAGVDSVFTHLLSIFSKILVLSFPLLVFLFPPLLSRGIQYVVFNWKLEL